MIPAKMKLEVVRVISLDTATRDFHVETNTSTAHSNVILILIIIKRL